MTTQTRHPGPDSHAPTATRPAPTTRPPNGLTLLAGVAVGAVAALLLPMTVFAGADEAVTTGALLVAFSTGWAVMALLGKRRSGQAQPWAVVPGIAMGLTGLALIVTRPDDSGLAAATWVWPPLVLALVAWVRVQLRRSVPGRGRWVLTPVLVVLALASVGAVAGDVAVARDRAAYPAPGKLYDVAGHRLHLDCHGTGSPTVVLSNSLGGASAAWSRVISGLSPTTRTCAYDRAGQGWSEEAASPRDGVQSAAELHTLLAKAGEHGPYVLAGHSTGGTYAMTYAARYPDEVAGLVLIDSSSPEQLTRMPDFPRQYAMMRRTYGPLSTLARIGVGHLLPGMSPLPAKDAARLDAITSAPRAVRAQHDEVSVIPQVFRQARALTTLVGRPLVVLTASGTAHGTRGWTGAQDALARLSTNSVHRTVTSSHADMVAALHPAHEVVRALAEVVGSVRTHRPLPAR
jgi:pimeloyl-ACP methyl ester carboxylesterase